MKERYNILVTPTGGELSDTVIRVGHMGRQTVEDNDILFIDSSHVANIGSDVNYYLFEILPVLKSGVYIHIHDIAF